MKSDQIFCACLFILLNLGMFVPSLCTIFLSLAEKQSANTQSEGAVLSLHSNNKEETSKDKCLHVCRGRGDYLHRETGE